MRGVAMNVTSRATKGRKTEVYRLTPASIVPMTTPKSTPKPIPITPDMTVLIPQLFIMSSWTICSAEGICICLYSFLGLPLTAGFSGEASGSCAGASADGTGLEGLDVALSSCDVILLYARLRRFDACERLTCCKLQCRPFRNALLAALGR